MRAPSPSRRRRHRHEAPSFAAARRPSACNSPTRWRGKYLFDNALGFFAGARHLLSANNPHSRENFLQLIGCTVEMSLKSYLHFAGWNDDRCRDEIRHDLAKSLAASERLGFHQHHPDTRMLTRILSPYYRDHRTRELARRKPTPLSSARALRAAEVLLDDILAAVAESPRSIG